MAYFVCPTCEDWRPITEDSDAAKDGRCSKCGTLAPVTWITCPACEGAEGHTDEDDVWHPCVECDAMGGRDA